MGWVWRDDDESESSNSDQPSNFSTSTVVRSQCKTEEVEPGKFVRKCDKTQEILRHSLGKPSEVVQSTTEHTEEDVTNQMAKRSALPNQFEENPLNFPGFRKDVDTIERHFFGGVKSFFEAAEEMMSNSIFDIMGDLDSTTSKRGMPIEGRPKVEEHRNDENSLRQGEIDLSGLAKDV